MKISKQLLCLSVSLVLLWAGFGVWLWRMLGGEPDPGSFIGAENYLRLFLEDETFFKALFDTIAGYELGFLIAALLALGLAFLFRGARPAVQRGAGGGLAVLAALLAAGLLLWVRLPLTALILSCLTALCGIAGLFLLKRDCRSLADGTWADYALLAGFTVIGFVLYSTASGAIGMFWVGNVLLFFAVLQLAWLHCFVYWCVLLAWRRRNARRMR